LNKYFKYELQNQCTIASTTLSILSLNLWYC